MNPEEDHPIEKCTPDCFENEKLNVIPAKQIIKGDVFNHRDGMSELKKFEAEHPLIPCVMCKKEFEKGQLDFLERCDACFRIFMDTPEDQRPKIGVPYVPIYNGD